MIRSSTYVYEGCGAGTESYPSGLTGLHVIVMLGNVMTVAMPSLSLKRFVVTTVTPRCGVPRTLSQVGLDTTGIPSFVQVGSLTIRANYLDIGRA